MELVNLDRYEKDIMAGKAAQICQLIGCSGLSPDMCQNRPEICSITRKFADTYESWLDTLKGDDGDV